MGVPMPAIPGVIGVIIGEGNVLTCGLRGVLGVGVPRGDINRGMFIRIAPPRMPIGRPPALAVATAAMSPSGLHKISTVDRENRCDILCSSGFGVTRLSTTKTQLEHKSGPALLGLLKKCTAGAPGLTTGPSIRQCSCYA